MTDNIELCAKEKLKHKKHCIFCGHTISFYAFEPDRKCCSHCGKYNYRSDKYKFKYLLNEYLKKSGGAVSN